MESRFLGREGGLPGRIFGGSICAQASINYRPIYGCVLIIGQDEARDQESHVARYF
jgi:hypothetical protein